MMFWGAFACAFVYTTKGANREIPKDETQISNWTKWCIFGGNIAFWRYLSFCPSLHLVSSGNVEFCCKLQLGSDHSQYCRATKNLEILHWTASTATYLIRARGAAGRGKTFSCFTRQQWCDWVCCSETDPPPTDKWAGARRDKNCAKKLWPGGERFHTNERSVSGKLQGETIAMKSFEQSHRNPLDDCTEILRRIAWKSIEKLRKNQVHLLVTPEWS